VPIQPISEGQILATLEGLETSGTTPLAYTLRQIPSDLEGLEGPIVIVFVTDGMETCKEDPVAAASELAASGLDIIFLLVGFDIDSAGPYARSQLKAIADAVGGRYTDVSTGAELLSAFNLVLGTYSVAVETDPQLLFEDVVIERDETVTITVPSD
jgi:Ca-activated chloride channel family protein